MSELSSDARALVDAARAHDGPSLRDRSRVKERLVRQLGVSAFAGAAAVSTVRSAASAPPLTRVRKAGAKPAGVAGRQAARGGSPLWLKSLGKVAAAATAAGAIYSGVTLLGAEPSKPPAPRRLEQLEQPALEPTTEPLVDAQPQPAPAVVVPATIERRHRQGRSARRTHEVTSDSLAEELSLLARAQRALRADDARAALAIVQQHTARFPEGSLQEERSGIEALARCLLGESDADSVKSFLKRSPSSPLAARVRKECGSRR